MAGEFTPNILIALGVTPSEPKSKTNSVSGVWSLVSCGLDSGAATRVSEPLHPYEVGNENIDSGSCLLLAS